MTKDDLAQKELPDSPGVYFFIGAQEEILYIGKATSLKNRVRSYFAPDIKEKRSTLIESMVTKAVRVDVTRTDSTLEALILEANLIRTHKPYFNTKSKDDKSYNHLIITNEEWPRVLVIRAKDLTEQYTLDDIQAQFGPYPNGLLFREAMKIVRKLFKFYDTEKPLGEERSKVVKGRIDFNKQIGLYPNSTNKADYLKTIRQITLFFEGRKAELIDELHTEMMQYASVEKFEDAARIKRKIYALEHIQDVSLIRDDRKLYRDDRNVRIEAYDVAHIQGKDMVGVMTVVEGVQPLKSEYRKFKIKSVQGSNDPAALKEVLERRFTHTEWPLPQILVVDGSTAQKNVAELTLKKFNIVIPVAAVVKNERHKPVKILASSRLVSQYEQAILLANAESHRFALAFHTQQRKKRFIP